MRSSVGGLARLGTNTTSSWNVTPTAIPTVGRTALGTCEKPPNEVASLTFVCRTTWNHTDA